MPAAPASVPPRPSGAIASPPPLTNAQGSPAATTSPSDLATEPTLVVVASLSLEIYAAPLEVARRVEQFLLANHYLSAGLIADTFLRGVPGVSRPYWAPVDDYSEVKAIIKSTLKGAKLDVTWWVEGVPGAVTAAPLPGRAVYFGAEKSALVAAAEGRAHASPEELTLRARRAVYTPTGARRWRLTGLASALIGMSLFFITEMVPGLGGDITGISLWVGGWVAAAWCLWRARQTPSDLVALEREIAALSGHRPSAAISPSS